MNCAFWWSSLEQFDEKYFLQFNWVCSCMYNINMNIFIENQTHIDISCLVCVLCYISTGSWSGSLVSYIWMCSKLDHPQRKYYYSKREAFKFEEREREREHWPLKSWRKIMNTWYNRQKGRTGKRKNRYCCFFVLGLALLGCRLGDTLSTNE